MYNNNYSNFPYNPYSYNPTLGNAAGINSPYQSQNQEIIKVNGREGANAYPLNTPNSSVMMLDINNPILYVKVSDGAGYCNITTYSISPFEQEIKTSISTDDLEKRIKRLEDLYEPYFTTLEDIKQSKSTQPNSKH